MECGSLLPLLKARASSRTPKKEGGFTMNTKKNISCLLLLVSCLLLLASTGWAGGGGSYDKSNEMVLIPDGMFLMGSKEDEGRVGVEVGVDELPQREVYLKAFYIDKYEVTVGAYRKFAELSIDGYRKFAKDEMGSPSVLLIGGLTGERARMKKMRVPIADDDFPMREEAPYRRGVGEGGERNGWKNLAMG